MEELSKEKLDQILEELAGYEVDIEEDPTLPDLRNKYINKILSQCRNYLNRTQYYLGLVKKLERSLKTEVKELELDIDFKSKQILVRDEDVRRMPNIRDREALVSSKLYQEHEVLNRKKIDLLDLEETAKIIKHKYDHLKGVNLDIKLQRQMVKEDLLALPEGGYISPHKQPGKPVPDGMPPVVNMIDPKDILDPNSRPEEIPIPVDHIHASQLSAFYSHIQQEKVSPEVKPEVKPEDKEIPKFLFENLLED
jgi:hypothetical protein